MYGSAEIPLPGGAHGALMSIKIRSTVVQVACRCVFPSFGLRRLVDLSDTVVGFAWNKIPHMTRIVGNQNRSEFILDPTEVLRRGVALDGLWPALLARRPRGVMRATHREFNAMDDQRQLDIARLLNGPKPDASAP